jgi:SAM-dependent methyltransferase
VVAVIRISPPTERARRAAFGEQAYVEQESFVRAGEVRSLAEHAGVSAGTTVLDVCCGIGGAGRFLTRDLGCSYVGVDADERSVAVARRRAAGLDCRFEAMRVPPLPAGRFDVVMLLETLLAFPDKGPLLGAIAGALVAGGRFACTVEEGLPLTPAERARMPNADTVWPTPLASMHALLERHGLAVRWQEDWTAAHRRTAAALVEAYTAAAPAIAGEIGREPLNRLLVAHELWLEWLGTGRIRKFAMVAERVTADC